MDQFEVSCLLHTYAERVRFAENDKQLKRQLEYKSFEHGTDFVKIDTFFASSQTCSCCGFKNETVKDLKVRSWTCPKCGAEHDRDANAATNILNEGLRILQQRSANMKSA